MGTLCAAHTEAAAARKTQRTFFVMMKLEPMASVPDVASAMPMYLSSTILGKYVRIRGGGRMRREKVKRRCGRVRSLPVVASN